MIAERRTEEKRGGERCSEERRGVCVCVCGGAARELDGSLVYCVVVLPLYRPQLMEGGASHM
jgi:hypothetical protein